MKFSVLFIITIVISFFSGCSQKNSLLPLVEDCCKIENNQTKLKNKRIYLGHFNYQNKLNQKNIVGIRNKKYTKDEPKDINLDESLDVIIRMEFSRQLSTLGAYVQFVDKKPTNLNENELYLSGDIIHLWIKQDHVTMKNKDFEFANFYNFSIKSNLNNEIIEDTFDAKLDLQSETIKQSTNKKGIVAALLFEPISLGDALAGDIGNRIYHTLNINNELIARIEYYQYLESGIGRFKTTYEMSIDANIYKPYLIHVEDSSKGEVGKFEQMYMLYSYISPNLNASPGYNFLGNDTFDLYLSKNEVEKIKKENNIYELDYQECLKKNIYPSTTKCEKLSSRDVSNTKYYDLFRQYTTTSGILQYMINQHIKKVISTINK